MSYQENQVLKIASRESALALWQAEHIKSRLETLHPGLEVEIVGMTTQGDQILDVPLAKVGGKGLFVKELEHSLLKGETDIAVHSMKDVPMELPQGLCLPVICERESPFDALVSDQYKSLDDLPEGAHVGTSSLRRSSQLKHLRPDLTISSLRGNVNTRLRKLDEGNYDAIILAASGLIRLGLANRISAILKAEESLPAVGQGALGIECRSDDEQTIKLIKPLLHEQTMACVLAERAFSRRLEGGCQVPMAGFAEMKEESISMSALVASVDGQKVLIEQTSGSASQAEALGLALAEKLLEQGAKPLLDAVLNK